MRNKAYSLLGIFITLAACTSLSRGPERLNRLDDAQAPKDIVDDFSQHSAVKFFPFDTAKSKNAKDLICSANQSKLNLTFNVKVIPPKPLEGTPIDEAAKAKAEFLSNVRDFLKYRFFMSLAKKPADIPISQNQSAKYDIPILADSTSKGIETFYKNLRYKPTFYEKRWLGPYGGNAKIDKQFFAFILSNKEILLTPKVSNIAMVGYDDYSHEPVIQRTDLMTFAEWNQSLHVLNISQAAEYHNHVAVVPSQYKWKDKDQKFQTLRLAQTDLSAIVDNFTFALPVKVIETKFGANNSNSQQSYGIDFETHQFSPAKAIEGQYFIWENVLRESTNIKEHQESNQVLYEVSLDFTDFCAYGVAIDDLKAK